MDERRRRGNRGEDAVAAALVRRGYRLLERQYRCRWGELDLIVQSPAGILCFVEVKRRGPGAIGLPREFVGARKRERLRKAAAAYLSVCQWDGPVRFDVAEVYEGREGGLRVFYLENAFQDDSN